MLRSFSYLVLRHVKGRSLYTWIRDTSSICAGGAGCCGCADPSVHSVDGLLGMLVENKIYKHLQTFLELFLSRILPLIFTLLIFLLQRFYTSTQWRNCG